MGRRIPGDHGRAILVWFAPILGAASSARPARACTSEAAYYVLGPNAGQVPSIPVAVQGNTVNVCFLLTASPVVMLRQDTATGAIAKLADFPVPDADGGGVDLGNAFCYEDPCVPPGTYRYGAASASCSLQPCGGEDNAYYTTVVVSSPLPAGCAPSDGNPGAAPTDAGVPWPSGGDGFYACPGGSGGCSTSGEPRSRGVLVGAVAVGLAALATALRARRAGG